MKYDDYFFLYDVPDHNDIKDKLLLYFDDMTEKYNLEKNHSSAISSTDYWFRNEKPYSYLLEDSVYSTFEKDVLNKFNCQGVKYQGAWFQQYEEGSWFSYHTHPNSHFAGIYYIESPAGSETEFIIPGGPIPQEGQVLIFPSFIPHRSNPNPSSDRKTVVAFNFDLYYKKYIKGA